MVYFKIALIIILIAIWYSVIRSKIENYMLCKQYQYLYNKRKPIIEALKTDVVDFCVFIIINLILIGLIEII